MKKRFCFLAFALIGILLTSVSCTKDKNNDPGSGWIKYNNVQYNVKSAGKFTVELNGITNGKVYTHDIISGVPNGSTLLQFYIYSASEIPEPGVYTYGLDESHDMDQKERYIGRAVRQRLMVEGQEIIDDPAISGTITVVVSGIDYSELKGEFTLESGKTINFNYKGHL